MVCSSSTVNPEGCFVTCARTSGHSGSHRSDDGATWPDKRRARGTTTGSSTRPAITFRAPTAEHYDRLARTAFLRGTTVNALAKERVFPTRKPKAASR